MRRRPVPEEADLLQRLRRVMHPEGRVERRRSSPFPRERCRLDWEERLFELEWCLLKAARGLEKHFERRFDAALVTERRRRVSDRGEVSQFELDSPLFSLERGLSVAVETPFLAESLRNEDALPPGKAGVSRFEIESPRDEPEWCLFVAKAR